MADGEQGMNFQVFSGVPRLFVNNGYPISSKLILFIQMGLDLRPWSVKIAVFLDIQNFLNWHSTLITMLPSQSVLCCLSILIMLSWTKNSDISLYMTSDKTWARGARSRLKLCHLPNAFLLSILLLVSKKASPKPRSLQYLLMPNCLYIKF